MILPVQRAAIVAAGGQFAADLGGRLDLLTIAGSHAYGTNHPKSDVDLRGIYTLPKSRFLGIDKPTRGFDHIGNVMDISLKELAEFVRLAMVGNPHVLETLFAEEEDVILSTAIGKKVRKSRTLFVTQKSARAALGYFTGQVNDLSQMDPNHRRFMKTKGHVVRLYFAFTHMIDTGTCLVRLNDEQRNYITEMQSRPNDDFIKFAFAMVEILNNVRVDVLPPDVSKKWANDFVLQLRHM